MQSDVRTHHEEAKEEFMNCVTSALGALFAALGAYLMIDKALLVGGTWRITSVTLYVITTITALTISAVYHGTRSKEWKRKFRLLDHASIYLMIAGGYSPLLMISLKNDYGGILCAALWFVAILCVLWKLFYFEMPESLSLASYLLLGWGGIFVVEPLMENIPTQGLLMILAGGLLYTIGAIFYINDHRKWYHTIWHFFVLLASACHFIAIYKFVILIP
jgi:hemolysin III